jgi:hypothetical protein
VSFFALEGHLRIAQRFIAGIEKPETFSVPEGRLKRSAPPCFQSSLRDCRPYFASVPSDKSLGYCQTSLRDKSAAIHSPIFTPEPKP